MNLQSYFSFGSSKFNGKKESKRLRKEVGNVVDVQRVGILEFALSFPQHQTVNRSFTR